MNESLLHASHNICCAAAALEFPVLMPEVAEACRKRVEAGSLWDASYPLKLVELRGIMRTHKPRSVVEIGSGATSLVLQSFCKNVLTIEDKDWGGTATRVVNGDFVKFAETVDIVREPPDLLYVDGPNSRCDVPGKALVSTDAADLIAAGVLPGVIVFDLRHGSVAHTKQVAGDRYVLAPSQLIADGAGMPWYTAGLKIHSMFVRVK